jgi:small subunit ribosomal protein S20
LTSQGLIGIVAGLSGWGPFWFLPDIKQTNQTIDRSRTLANSPQARKRARQAEKRRQHNAAMRSMVRTYLKKVNAAIASGDQAAASQAYQTAVSVLDKATRKGKFHANKAARHKSRLNAKIKEMGAAA